MMCLWSMIPCGRSATYRDSIRPTRLALNLHLVVPAASVTLPKTTSDLVP
jgi:hypothetical protein